MSELSRREVLGILGMALVSGAFGCNANDVENAARNARQVTTPFVPKFFTEPEWKAVRALADIVLPKDGRSGSATEAGVPEFMDFILLDSPSSGESMRKGLVWLDVECRKRFTKTFADCTGAEQTALLNEIAWPKQAKPAMQEGVEFFNQFRNLTATGFFSSKMGVEDLQYIGNTFNPGWNGCPDAAMAKLGVSYV